MKKYIKPEIEITKFNISSAVMNETATPSPTPTATIMPYSVTLSANDNTMYSQNDVDAKVWAEYSADGSDWNWTDK